MQQFTATTLPDALDQAFPCGGPSFMLPQGWISFKLTNEITAYYNFHDRCFSFSPILNPLDFLTISNRLVPINEQLTISELQNKISQIESHLKSQTSDGQIPSRPVPLQEQLNTLLQLQNQPVPGQSQQAAPVVKKYLTKKKYNEIKGLQKTTEQISILVAICTQEFQLSPNFVFEKIDDGRFQHLCKVDFHGVHISTGKGHNKSESKKDASAYAIKLVAPNVYKELLSEHASTNHSQVQNENLPPLTTTDMPQVPHRKVVMQEEIKTQSFSDSPMKIVGHKRIEAPTHNLLVESAVEEEEGGQNLVAAEISTGILDSQIRLSFPDILKRKSLFKKYTPYTLLKLIGTQHNYIFKKCAQPTRRPDPNETLRYQLEVHLNNQRQYVKAVYAPSETAGKLKASLEILREMFREQDPKWCDLVDQMSSKIEEDRLKRGAGVKPVLRPREEMMGTTTPKNATVSSQDCIIIE